MTPADDRDIDLAAELRRHREGEQREDDARQAELPRAIGRAWPEFMGELGRMGRYIERAAVRWAKQFMR